MNIADIALVTLSSGNASHYAPQEAKQAVSVEFDTMLFSLLLRAGGNDETSTMSPEMNVWNNMLAASLARDLASNSGFSLAATLMNESAPSAGGDR
jgi:Rod binding domain-containing protein